MAQYNIDEFIAGGVCTDTVDTIVDKKVSLLYDFCILTRDKYTHVDSREHEVRALLTACGTEERMTILLHDVLACRTTIDDLLRKGVV